MPIVEYTPKYFEDVSELASQVPGPMNLAHRPFVDYYYASQERCRLYLYYSETGKIIGTLGRELAPFLLGSRDLTVRIATNWYSLQRGIGGELYQYSAQANPNSVGLMFSGSQTTLSILRHHNWIFISGIRGYFLNYTCHDSPADAWWRRASKSILRRVVRRKIPAFASRLPPRAVSEIAVREEGEYSADLLPSRSPFLFRLAAGASYLGWRYNLSLSFVRYRLFRILVRGKSAGYVILSDWPQKIVVAHCDAEDPVALAYGTLLSILEAGREDTGPRMVYLTCSHLEMCKIFRKFGFWREPGGSLPFAFRTPPPGLDLAADTSQWLVNFDWGDNGVRPPFLDQPGADPSR